MHLERLGPRHAPALLAGQDDALAREIIGRPWEPRALAEFLERCDRWRGDGPVREFAALDGPGGALLGGGGLHRLAAGLAPQEASLTYWVLAAHRGRGLGPRVAGALVAEARRDPRIECLVLWIDPANTASGAVARDLGARDAGTRDRHPADASREAGRWLLPLR